jgi:hypothetical protein
MKFDEDYFGTGVSYSPKFVCESTSTDDDPAERAVDSDTSRGRSLDRCGCAVKSIKQR